MLGLSGFEAPSDVGPGHTSTGVRAFLGPTLTLGFSYWVEDSPVLLKYRGSGSGWPSQRENFCLGLGQDSATVSDAAIASFL